MIVLIIRVVSRGSMQDPASGCSLYLRFSYIFDCVINSCCHLLKDMRPHPKEASALEDMDKRYLRNAIVMGFRKGVLPKNSPMFGLLSGLLGFSSEDVEDKKEESGALPKQMGKGLSTLQSVLRRLKKS